MRLDAHPLVALRDAGVVIGGTRVLVNVRLELDAGEFLAILGPNGSGKTTLVRAALGLVATTSGEVRLFGERLRSFSEWWRIGYVPQRVAATTGVPATVSEVVVSGRMARSRRVGGWSARDRAAARRALEVVGLAPLERASVATLSAGQQQRVLIARALAGEPELLVLDEPVSSIDLDTQRALARTLGVLASNGSTIALVAHALGPLAPLVTRTVVLDAGRVVYDGAPRPGDAETGHVHPHEPAGEAQWPAAVEP